MGTVLLFSLRTIIRSLITLQMLSNLGNKFDSFKKYQSPKSFLREAILHVDNYLPLKNYMCKLKCINYINLFYLSFGCIFHTYCTRKFFIDKGIGNKKKWVLCPEVSLWP